MNDDYHHLNQADLTLWHRVTTTGPSPTGQLHIRVVRLLPNSYLKIFQYIDIKTLIQVLKLSHLAPNVHSLLGRKASGQVNTPLLQQKGTNHGLKLKLITTGGVLKCGTLAVGVLTFAVGGSSSTAPSNHTTKFSTKQLDLRFVTLNRHLTGLIV